MSQTFKVTKEVSWGPIDQHKKLHCRDTGSNLATPFLPKAHFLQQKLIPTSIPATVRLSKLIPSKQLRVTSNRGFTYCLDTLIMDINDSGLSEGDIIGVTKWARVVGLIIEDGLHIS